VAQVSEGRLPKFYVFRSEDQIAWLSQTHSDLRCTHGSQGGVADFTSTLFVIGVMQQPYLDPEIKRPVRFRRGGPRRTGEVRSIL
jgi:hypothetical protein